MKVPRVQRCFFQRARRSLFADNVYPGREWGNLNADSIFLTIKKNNNPSFVPPSPHIKKNSHGEIFCHKGDTVVIQKACGVSSVYKDDCWYKKFSPEYSSLVFFRVMMHKVSKSRLFSLSRLLSSTRAGAGAVIPSTDRRGRSVLLRGGILSIRLTTFRGYRF